MIDGQAGRIAVITDGKDTCGPPPCEVIEVLRRRNPGVRVDVVDVSGRSDATCLALATGGTFRVAPLSGAPEARSEEHTSELQSLMRISYAVFCLKKKKNTITTS